MCNKNIKNVGREKQLDIFVKVELTSDKLPPLPRLPRSSGVFPDLLYQSIKAKLLLFYGIFRQITFSLT
jgi:hypothetical protein